jgi:hypothetical protein
MLETLLVYALCGVPAYLIACPRAWLRSALAYIAGVIIALAALVAVGWSLDLSNQWFESHIGQVFLVPAVGVGVAWSVKTATLRPVDQLAAGSMLVRLGIFLGWLFNAVAAVCASIAGFVVYNQQGALSNNQTFMVTALLVIAAGVWLLGRGIRFVFVGPKQGSVQEPADRCPPPLSRNETAITPRQQSQEQQRQSLDTARDGLLPSAPFIPVTPAPPSVQGNEQQSPTDLLGQVAGALVLVLITVSWIARHINREDWDWLVVPYMVAWVVAVCLGAAWLVKMVIADNVRHASLRSQSKRDDL